MTIDEAIQHCEEVAAGETAQGKCPECAAEHRQLAAWLLELVARRAQQTNIATPSNAPITLDELRDMDGEAVFLKRPGYCDRWALVMVHPEVNTPFFLFHLGGVVLAKLELEQGAKAYRRKPEEEAK